MKVNLKFIVLKMMNCMTIVAQVYSAQFEFQLGYTEKDQPGIYPVPSAPESGKPGARHLASMCVDPVSDHIFLYAGFGYASDSLNLGTFPSETNFIMTDGHIVFRKSQ